MYSNPNLSSVVYYIIPYIFLNARSCYHFVTFTIHEQRYHLHEKKFSGSCFPFQVHILLFFGGAARYNVMQWCYYLFSQVFKLKGKGRPREVRNPFKKNKYSFMRWCTIIMATGQYLSFYRFLNLLRWSAGKNKA